MERTFVVEGTVQSVDDIMIGIPRMFRDEFVGKTFATFKELGRCLEHADVAKRAKLEHSWKYDDELKAMREYLR